MKNIKNWILRIILFASFLIIIAANAQAATRTVTKIQDTSDGVCDADCSLREAIDAANPGDRIIFSSLFNTPQTISLSPVLPYNGGLTISMNLTINGPGADLLTVFGINNEVFEISSGIVIISGMTITGNGDDGILNYGTTTVSECILTGIDYNALNNNSVMTVVNSTITENGNSFQEAVLNNGELTLLNSTVSYNSYEGITNFGTLTVTNSTVSGNGGTGIQNGSGTAMITAGTIVYNAGGIEATGGTVTVRNTIAAGTTVINGRDVDENLSGLIISGGYNLIGADPGLFTSLGDQTGTFITPLDPLLDPLADYGGMTATHRLRTNSPAIDKGYSFGLTDDQRGYLRPFDKANYGNATGGDGSDIGAYELQFAVFVTGGVYTPLGVPIKNTRVLLRGANGFRRAVRTDRFGIYRFNNVARNRTYQVSVTHRQFEFTPQIIMVQEENISNLNFMALP